jgi:hypothetical protein
MIAEERHTTPSSFEDANAKTDQAGCSWGLWTKAPDPEPEIADVTVLAAIRRYEENVVQKELAETFSSGPMNLSAFASRAIARLGKGKHGTCSLSDLEWSSITLRQKTNARTFRPGPRRRGVNWWGSS